MSDLDYKQLATQMLEQLKTQKEAAAPPNNIVGHGNGGLFSQPALDASLFGAFVMPNFGLYSILPLYPTIYEHLVAGIVTGVTDSTGSEPSGLCDDPPYAGLMKLCQQAYPLGRFSRRSRTGELDAFGKLANRGEHTDHRLFGNAADSLPAAPSLNASNFLSSETDKILFELGVSFTRDIAPQIWTGTPANNTAQGGTRYFWGLDYLINTGYHDTYTSTACPAADPLIASFGDVQVQADTAGIVNHITQITYEIWQNRARQFGLMPVTGAIVMRPQLFHIITSYWPCTYLTYRCITAAGSEGAVDSTDAVNLRDAMRAGSYLMIDGVKVPVIQDDTIAETNVGAGVYESSIYWVPLTVLGGKAVTYLEYFNYDTPEGFVRGAQELANGGAFNTSNAGRFAWHKSSYNWCVEVLVKTEQRLLLRTPQISARLTDVRYVPYVHERDWDPDGTYFANGGGISQAKQTYYGPNDNTAR